MEQPLVQVPSLEELINRIVFTEREINGLVIEQAKRAAHSVIDSQEIGITVITVKNGAIPYCQKLKCEMTRIFFAENYKVIITDDDIKLKSYDGTTQKEIIVEEDIKTDITNQLVIVAEDIQDTGKTLDFLYKHLKSKNPKNICFSVFLKRKVGYLKDYRVDIGAYTLSDGWFVGFGLDYYGHYRELSYLAEIKDEYKTL